MESDLKYDYGVEDKLGKPYSIFAKIHKMIPAGTHVLDVGCHTGNFGAALKRNGCRVTGIEINSSAAQRARLVLDQVIVGDVEQLELFQNIQERYGVVLFLDLLEHCRWPEEVLKAVQALLLPGGCVIASIPNIGHWSIRRNLLAGKFDYEPVGLMDETHLRFYTIKTARELFQTAGYQIDVMDHRYRLPMFRERKWVGGLVTKNLGPIFPGLLSYQILIKAILSRSIDRPCGELPEPAGNASSGIGNHLL